MVECPPRLNVGFLFVVKGHRRTLFLGFRELHGPVALVGDFDVWLHEDCVRLAGRPPRSHVVQPLLEGVAGALWMQLTVCRCSEAGALSSPRAVHLRKLRNASNCLAGVNGHEPENCSRHIVGGSYSANAKDQCHKHFI